MNRSGIFFKSQTTGPRLRYVVSELFERRMGLDVTFLSSELPPPEGKFTIGYGQTGCHLYFPVSGILEELNETNYTVILSENAKESSFVRPDRSLIKGDLPGMVFWLLSRYEEYQNQSRKDEHGRFPSSENTLVKCGVHSFPIIEKWISDLASILMAAGIQTQLLPFSKSFSFDLDNPTAFLYKNFFRQSMAIGRDLLQLKIRQLFIRNLVLSGFREDPFENMSRIGEIVSGKNLFPDLFVWIGDYGPHDKGLKYTSNYFKKLISDLSKSFSIGLHPSYGSFNNMDKMKREKSRLEEIINSEIKKNRFHYLRFQIPESYRNLLALGFNEDHSMGFADRFGYRAGTGQSFYWYDLEAEEKTSLLIFPFSMMDSTAHFKMKLSSKEFLDHLKHQTGNNLFHGSIHCIFHNEHPSWKGWENMLARFIDETEKLA
jgi:hypothetical protein